MQKTFVCATLAGCAAALTLTSAAAGDSPAIPPDAVLTGQMATWQYLVGSWHCDVKIGAMQGEKATTAEGVIAYAVVLGNALHSHVTAKDYAADSYVGYVDAAKSFWMNTIDAFGNLGSETSVDGKLFTGSSQGGAGKIEIRDTLTRPAPATIRDVQEFKIGAAWQMASDSTCTRI